MIAAAANEATPNGKARAALALWRGPALADLADEPFAAEPVRSCEELRLRAHELAIDGDLAAGRHAAVLGELAALAAEHPLRERIQAQHMLALYRSGWQADALEAYRTARRRIVDAIGAEPGPDLRRLHEAILRHEESVAPPAPPAPPSRRRARLPALAAVAMLVGIVPVLAVVAIGGSDPAEPQLAENRVGVFDAGSTGLRGVERVGRGPAAIALGAGSAWVANSLDDTVTRIAPGEDRRVTIAAGAHPTALAFGAGSLWVASGDDGAVAQVDPAADRVVQRIPVGGQPGALAVGHGAVWVAQPREDVVTRIDLSAGRATQRIAAGAGPAALAAGPGGVWVAAEDSDQLIRIDPASGKATASVNVLHGPDAVAVADGAVWVANGADGTVSRVDPAAAMVTGTVRVGSQVTALAADGSGVVAANERGMLARIDDSGSRMTSRVATGAAVSALAGDRDELWVAGGAPAGSHRGGTLTAYAGDCGQPCPVDPGFALPQSWGALGLVYDGLVGYRRAPGAAGGQIVPALAANVPAPQDGGRTYVFTLRPGIRYADGRELRASDVRSSLERSIRLGHELLPGLFDAIRGAPACALRPQRCSLARGVLADDRARTVTLRLRRPDPLLLHKLANPGAAIVPAGTPDDLDGPRPPGTGPYRIERVEHDGTTRLIRNPEFKPWSNARPDGFPDVVVLRPWTDLRPALAAVERGRSDVTAVDNGGRRLQADQLGGVLTRHPGRVAVAPRLATDFMFLNVREPPFDDVRVRRAVNLATDRARMVALSGGPSAAVPACSVVPAGLPNTRPACSYTKNPSPAGTWTAPDPAKAHRLITASGTRGTRVTVWTDTDKIRFGRYFVHLLRDLGYTTRLKIVDVGFDYFRAVGDSRTHAQIGMTGWLADYPAPATFYDPIFSCAARAGNVRQSPFLGPLLEQIWVR